MGNLRILITANGQDSWRSSTGLAGAVDLGTVDWIWDEYVEHSTCGRNYSRDHRPTDPANFPDFVADPAGDDALREWLDRLSRLRAARVDAMPRTAGIGLKAVLD